MPVAAQLYYHIYEGSDQGQKPPVILIHGAGGTHLYWPSEVRRLAGYRLYALDLPGHGKSGGRGQQSISAYVEQLIEWMNAIQLHGAVFIGHSMGSAIGLSLALDYPDQVLGLGLVGSGSRLKVAAAILDAAASETTFQNAVDQVVSNSFSEKTAPGLVEQAAKRMAETRPSVLYGDFLACNSFDVTERLGEIDQPTWIACGAEDRMTPRRYSQFLADHIPGSSMKIFPDAGHMLMLEQPQIFANALSDFLASLYY